MSLAVFLQFSMVTAKFILVLAMSLIIHQLVHVRSFLYITLRCSIEYDLLTTTVKPYNVCVGSIPDQLLHFIHG